MDTTVRSTAYHQRFLTLIADVSLALTEHERLPDMLQTCAVAIVRQTDVAYARIWVMNEDTNHLELQASAGIYTRLDGPYARVPIGKWRIGQIASERMPFFTNNSEDECIQTDYEFVAPEKIVGFAGHPLMVGNRLVGVIALYSRSRLEQDTLAAIGAVAENIANAIERSCSGQPPETAELLFKQFAESMSDVFWVSAPDGSKHHYLSPAVDKVYGHPRQELYDYPYRFLEWIVPEDRERVLEHTEKNQNNPKPRELEFDIIRGDGERRSIWVRVFPIMENGNVVRLCGLAHDVSERKQAERRVSEFYSMVSHELRTPLTSIRAALGLIEGGMTDISSEETMELIHIARMESDRLIRLINDILEMRKMEAGKLPLKIQMLKPSDVVETTLAAMRSMAHEANISLVSSIKDDVEFLGDRDRVIQVLTNLISNALKFSPAGGTIVINVWRPQLRVRFSVVDNGPGISDKHKDKLFGLFQQVDSSDSRARGGTGLGLSISKAIIELLGGEIGLESQVGVGSVFWFDLPIAFGGIAQTEPRDNSCGNDTIQALIDEYARSLPQKLKELSRWLPRARESREPVLLDYCLILVRKLKASSEPCGFPMVAERMTMIEGELLSIIQRTNDTAVESSWKKIALLLQQTLA